MNGMALKQLAHSLAIVMHERQSRKGTGEPYINHVERIADSVNGWKAKTVAYLHDVVEDTPITLDMLALMFPEEIVEAVDVLTRRPHPAETYKEFIQRACDAGGIALIVKIADVRDNLRDIGDVPDGGPGLERRYTSALATLLEASDESMLVVPPRLPESGDLSELPTLDFDAFRKCSCGDGGHENKDIPGRCLCGGRIER